MVHNNDDQHKDNDHRDDDDDDDDDDYESDDDDGDIDSALPELFSCFQYLHFPLVHSQTEVIFAQNPLSTENNMLGIRPFHLAKYRTKHVQDRNPIFVLTVKLSPSLRWLTNVRHCTCLIRSPLLLKSFQPLAMFHVTVKLRTLITVFTPTCVCSVELKRLERGRSSF